MVVLDETSAATVTRLRSLGASEGPARVEEIQPAAGRQTRTHGSGALNVSVDAAAGQSSYVNARMSLRPARVAVVFDGGHDWHYWVRLAIYAISQVWGGAGFILIPHQNGEVAPSLLQAASAYDPDHVALLRVTVRHLELARPGELPLVLDGQRVTGPARQQLIEQMGDQLLDDPQGEQARQVVAEVCSPYRHRTMTGGTWIEELSALNTDGTGSRLAPVSGLEGLPGGSRLAAPAGWGGPFGLAVAARCGALVEPVPGGHSPMGDDERLDLIRWLLSDGSRGAPPYSVVWHPAAAAAVLPAELGTAFDWGRHGLTVIQRGFAPSVPALLVAGNEAADFALALAWDRLYSRSLWLPSEWWPDLDVSTSEMTTIRLLLDDFGSDPTSPDAQVHLTTTSLGAEMMTKLASALDSPLIQSPGPAGQPARVVVEEPRFDRSGVRLLAVAGQFDQQFTVPVRTDGNGVVMMMPSPAPAVEDPDLAQSAGLRWHVDLELLSTTMPRGRGLDGQALFAPGENVHLTNVRSGRDGISYDAGRFDLVLAGTAPLSRLARPRLREPGLAEWARLLAGQSGLSFELSPAGRRAETLRKMWDGRKDFAAAMTGQLLPVLRAFQPAHAQSSAAYPRDEGVVLLNGVREGYLTFAGMVKFAGEGISASALRDGVDGLAARGLVRRGLVLGCSLCGRPSFIAIGNLAQVNQCSRCGAVSDLTQKQWRLPVEEPSWFYDLHPVARELLTDHGEIPLLLSRHLRSTSRRYDDAPELELRDASGTPVAEADLVAVSDDDVIVAEAKSNNALGANTKEMRRAAAKRVRLADVLRADQIILATTEPGWSGSSITEIGRAVTGRTWPAGLRPAIRLITGLGGEEIEDLRLDLVSGTTAKWS
jgi:hypothetical protein